MFVRVTTFEIDVLRMGVNQALESFKEEVLPELGKQPGYCGIQVLTTPEGRGLLLSYWQTEAEAEASVESGFYTDQMSKFLMIMKQPPGRDHYEVTLSEGVPVAASA